MRGKATKPRWKDQSPARRRCTVVAGIVQVVLALAAWSDLARRPAGAVRGRKRVWAAVIAVNFVGPIAYFQFGRIDSTVAGGGITG